MSKEDNIKEKFKIALLSTSNAISDSYQSPKEKNIKKKSIDLFEIEKLDNKIDFIKYRAESDSMALKKKFSNMETYKKNFPKNLSYKYLYEKSEQIRYELLGSKILKGVGNNLKENYVNQIILKKKKIS